MAAEIRITFQLQVVASHRNDGTRTFVPSYHTSLPVGWITSTQVELRSLLFY